MFSLQGFPIVNRDIGLFIVLIFNMIIFDLHLLGYQEFENGVALLHKPPVEQLLSEQHDWHIADINGFFNFAMSLCP